MPQFKSNLSWATCILKSVATYVVYKLRKSEVRSRKDKILVSTLKKRRATGMQHRWTATKNK